MLEGARTPQTRLLLGQHVGEQGAKLENLSLEHIRNRRWVAPKSQFTQFAPLRVLERVKLAEL